MSVAAQIQQSAGHRPGNCIESRSLTMSPSVLTLRRLAFALPVIFVLHVAEEAPGFVSWFNSLVLRHISQQLFLAVNLTAFVITVLLSLFVAAAPDRSTALLAVAWVGFLMFANGLFHAVATVAHGRYCPGVLTGVVLYLPFSCLFVRAVVKQLRVPVNLVISVMLAGGIPMFIHGFLIVFRGDRLF